MLCHLYLTQLDRALSYAFSVEGEQSMTQKRVAAAFMLAVITAPVQVQSGYTLNIWFTELPPELEESMTYAISLITWILIAGSGIAFTMTSSVATLKNLFSMVVGREGQLSETLMRLVLGVGFLFLAFLSQDIAKSFVNIITDQFISAGVLAPISLPGRPIANTMGIDPDQWASMSRAISDSLSLLLVAISGYFLIRTAWSMVANMMDVAQGRSGEALSELFQGILFRAPLVFLAILSVPISQQILQAINHIGHLSSVANVKNVMLVMFAMIVDVTLLMLSLVLALVTAGSPFMAQAALALGSPSSMSSVLSKLASSFAVLLIGFLSIMVCNRIFMSLAG
jgi:hypothetical protein